MSKEGKIIFMNYMGVSETPVSKLVSAISELEFFPELDDVTSMMRQKLESYFANVEPKDNKKWLDGVTYYSNGLCTTPGASTYIAILPWVNTSEVPDLKVAQEKRDRKELSDAIDGFCYWNQEKRYWYNLQLRITSSLPVTPALKLLTKKKYTQLVQLSQLDRDDQIPATFDKRKFNLEHVACMMLDDFIVVSWEVLGKSVKERNFHDPYENMRDSDFQLKLAETMAQVFGNLRTNYQEVTSRYRDPLDYIGWYDLDFVQRAKLVWTAIEALDDLTKDSEYRQIFVAAGLLLK